MSEKSNPKTKSNPANTHAPLHELEGIQVLLVEDELDIANLLIFVLEESGAEVIHMDSAIGALLALEQHEPHILICNIRLPDRDGTWLMRQIQGQRLINPAIPAIAVTSYTREVTCESAFRAGFQHFLEKPIDPDELVATILRLMEPG
jgi:CheY-like chemotaxis protein